MTDCPFCGAFGVDIGEHWRLIRDKYPVSKGHHLLVPVRHVEKLQDLSKEERAELGKATIETLYCVKMIAPCMDGFNMGLNQGEAAGQTVSHLHFHFIPRRHGDVKDPIGGVRGVIPEKRTYNKKL